jgi:transcriptional regulator with XRE-family HTH domain
MWLDNLKELKKEKGICAKDLAEKAGLPEKTVVRILSGKTASPYIDTLDRLATALGCEIGDILAGTKAVVGDSNLSALQEKADKLQAENELLIAETAILQEKVNALNAETELLKMKLMHKEELLAVHNYYTKIKGGDYGS